MLRLSPSPVGRRVGQRSVEHGVSCPYCIDRTSEERRLQFRERQHQVRLAAERGEQHIGQDQRKARERQHGDE